MTPRPLEIRALPPALRLLWERRCAAAVRAERTRPLPAPRSERRRPCGHDEVEVGPSCVLVDRNGVEVCALQRPGVARG